LTEEKPHLPLINARELSLSSRNSLDAPNITGEKSEFVMGKREREREKEEI
jgi:hypothetical protein